LEFVGQNQTQKISVKVANLIRKGNLPRNKKCAWGKRRKKSWESKTGRVLVSQKDQKNKFPTVNQVFGKGVGLVAKRKKSRKGG